MWIIVYTWKQAYMKQSLSLRFVDYYITSTRKNSDTF